MLLIKYTMLRPWARRLGARDAALWFTVMASLTLVAGVSRAGDLTSMWSTHGIVMDGSLSEWDGALGSYESGRLSLAARNDGEFLIIALSIGDLALQRQVLGRGLTVYLDAEGGKRRNFGIHYPLGLDEMGLGPDAAAHLPAPPEGRRGLRPPLDPAELQSLYDDVSAELEVIDGPYSSHRLRVEDTPGIAVVGRYEKSILSYELRVPLLMSDLRPYAIGLDDSNKLGIGLVTPGTSERPRRGGPGDGGGGRGGGKGGGRGGGSGGRPGEGGEHRRDMSKPLDLWTKIKLAESG